MFLFLEEMGRNSTVEIHALGTAGALPPTAVY